MRRLTLCSTFLALTFLHGNAQSLSGVANDQLFRTLAALDSVLFSTMYTCDYERNLKLYTSDVEFYHDKEGMICQSREELAQVLQRNICDRITEVRLRRTLVPGSLQVFVLDKYGAMQCGQHMMFIYRKGSSSPEIESAKFIRLWKLTNGKWQVSRVISYDHQAIAPD